MRKLFFSIFLIGFSTSIFGQYTDIINSNQPGNSQSAYALGKKVLQFEGGLWVENRKHTHTHQYVHQWIELYCTLRIFF
ncbi:hypothetical protein [Capnocytophaga canimorsus]|uniref:hypothetical protein n=1 Tax=Capnocytophaga canimorsus TaxID=28188 RepID=UPI00385D5473